MYRILCRVLCKIFPTLKSSSYVFFFPQAAKASVHHLRLASSHPNFCISSLGPSQDASFCRTPLLLGLHPELSRVHGDVGAVLRCSCKARQTLAGCRTTTAKEVVQPSAARKGFRFLKLNRIFFADEGVPIQLRRERNLSIEIRGNRCRRPSD